MDPPLLPYGECILKLSQLDRKNGNNVENQVVDIDKENKFYDPPPTLISALDVMHKRAESTLETTKQLHEFVLLKQKDKKLKMANQIVPEFILPNDYKATIHDVKIDGRGPDDKVYNKHPDIRKWIMRGNTLMKLHHNDIEQYYDVVIYGHKKFTGGVGDEDESQPENDESWRNYCLEDPDTANKVVVMDKLNGEAAHFSVRYIGGKFFIVTGSKNVHMLVHKIEDIDRYEGDRYQVAKAVARTVLFELSKIPSTNRQILYSILHHTKMTAVCELLQPDNQHIVNLEHLGQQPSLHIIAFTPCISSEPERERSVTGLPPNHALDLATTLGLKATQYRIINTDQVKQLRDRSCSAMSTVDQLFSDARKLSLADQKQLLCSLVFDGVIDNQMELLLPFVTQATKIMENINYNNELPDIGNTENYQSTDEELDDIDLSIVPSISPSPPRAHSASPSLHKCYQVTPSTSKVMTQLFESPISSQEYPHNNYSSPNISQVTPIAWIPLTPNSTPFKEATIISPQSDNLDYVVTCNPNEVLDRKVLFGNSENIDKEHTVEEYNNQQLLVKTLSPKIQDNNVDQDMNSKHRKVLFVNFQDIEEIDEEKNTVEGSNNQKTPVNSLSTIDPTQSNDSTNSPQASTSTEEPVNVNFKRGFEPINSQPVTSKEHQGLNPRETKNKKRKTTPLYAQNRPTDKNELRRWENAVNTEQYRRKKEKEISKMNEELEIKTNEVKNLKKENVQLKAEIDQKNKELNVKDVQMVENVQLKAEIDQKTKALEGKNIQISKIEADLKHYKQELEHYKQHNEKLQEYNDTFQKIFNKEHNNQ